MTEKQRRLKVFLCHTSSDKPAVLDIYNYLAKCNIDVWLDTKSLIPGQNWRNEIPSAVKNSDIVIVCVSSNSLTKEGFVQKEIKFSLDIAEEKPDGTIFIIPARLERCQVPEKLGKFQYVDIFLPEGYDKLFKALEIRANQLQLQIPTKTEFKVENAQEPQLYNQFGLYSDYTRVFLDLENTIRDYIENKRITNTEPLNITLKLIAVAMTFSWNRFISIVIPDLLTNYPTLTINIDIVFVNHDFLQMLKVGQVGINWARQSKYITKEVKEFYDKYRKLYERRLNFRVKTYSNLPHWHGWLFNSDNLYLGITNWKIRENNLPEMSVGMNQYRHFGDPANNPEAAEQIRLFENWHKYYFDFASEWIVGNSI